MKYSFSPSASRYWRPDEAEAVAEFEQEGLQAGDQAVLQLPLLHLATDAEELQFHDRIPPTVGLLFFHDGLSDVPVEQGRLMADGPCGRDAGADHPRLQFFYELPVIGIARQGGIRWHFHFASPSSIFSASFSSLQNSASKSFAGVGGW